MVDRDGLENRCACKRTVGSNPTLSAILPSATQKQSALRAPSLQEAHPKMQSIGDFRNYRKYRNGNRLDCTPWVRQQ